MDVLTGNKDNYSQPNFSCLDPNMQLIEGSRPYQLFKTDLYQNHINYKDTDDSLNNQNYMHHTKNRLCCQNFDRIKENVNNDVQDSVAMQFNFSCNKGFITFLFTPNNPNLYTLKPKDIYLVIYLSLDYPERSRVSTIWQSNNHDNPNQNFPPIQSNSFTSTESTSNSKLISQDGCMSLYFDRISTVTLSSLLLDNSVNPNLIQNPNRFCMYFFNVNNLNVDAINLTRISQIQYLTLTNYRPDNFSTTSPRLLPYSPIIEYPDVPNPLTNFIKYCIPSADSSCCFAVCNWSTIPPLNSESIPVPVSGFNEILPTTPNTNININNNSNTGWPWWSWLLVIGGIIFLLAILFFFIYVAYKFIK